MTWLDLLEERQATHLTPQVWSCDCRTPIKKNGCAELTGKMYPTKVNKEDRCTRCGYYAYKIEKTILDGEKLKNHKRRR